MNKLITLTFSALLLSTMLTSCYPMPTEDDCSLIPTTNNPDRQRRESPLPQLPC